MPPIRSRRAGSPASPQRTQGRPRPIARTQKHLSDSKQNGPEGSSAADNGDGGDIDLDDEDDTEVAGTTVATALTSLSTSTLDYGMTSQRQRILERLSGSVRSDADLVGLEEQTYTLRHMLQSTVKRGESNSVLLVGPRGSGKSAILNVSLAMIGTPRSYHHVHLSAQQCATDRAAMRELARQLIQLGALNISSSSGAELGLDPDGEGDGGDGESDEEEEEEEHVASGQESGDEDHDPAAIDDEKEALGTAVLSSLSSTTSSILSLLASASPSSSSHSAAGATGPAAKPLIITLDHFDLLTARPRQALLYCLLDAVQSGTYRPGLAIVGMTRRVDTTDLLEKRVKSRFSHRIIQCYPPAEAEEWSDVVRKALTTRDHPIQKEESTAELMKTPAQAQALQEATAAQSEARTGPELEAFASAWSQEVEGFIGDATFQDALRSITDYTKDVQNLYDLLYAPVLALNGGAPRMSLPTFAQAALAARLDGTVRSLFGLPALPFLFLVAAKHLQTRDRAVFNFEIAFDEVARFSKRSRRNREGAGTGGLGLNAAVLDGSTTASPRRTPKKAAKAAGATATARPANVPEWEDRKRAMAAFELLLDLELILPDAFLSSLSFNLADEAGSKNTKGANSRLTTATQTRPPLLVQLRPAPTAVRKEYLRVRCITEPHVLLAVARERARLGTLSTEVVQWANKGG